MKTVEREISKLVEVTKEDGTKVNERQPIFKFTKALPESIDEFIATYGPEKAWHCLESHMLRMVDAFAKANQDQAKIDAYDFSAAQRVSGVAAKAKAVNTIVSDKELQLQTLIGIFTANTGNEPSEKELAKIKAMIGLV